MFVRCDSQDRASAIRVEAPRRVRRYVETRLASAACYGQFAAAAGIDVFDGEPIERFAAVGKMDERFLRYQQHELRAEMWHAATEQRSGRITVQS